MAVDPALSLAYASPTIQPYVHGQRSQKSKSITKPSDMNHRSSIGSNSQSECSDFAYGPITAEIGLATSGEIENLPLEIDRKVEEMGIPEINIFDNRNLEMKRISIYHSIRKKVIQKCFCLQIANFGFFSF